MTLMNYENGKTPLLIAVELHRHRAKAPVVFSNGNGLENADTNLFDNDPVNCVFENIQFSSSTSPPFENLEITFRFPHGDGDPHFEKEMVAADGYGLGYGIPELNDWLVLKTFERTGKKITLQSVFFARVYSVRGELRSNQDTGQIDKSLLHVRAEGFMDTLSRNHVCVGLVPTRGTLYNTLDWIEVKTKILEQVLDEDQNQIIGKRFRLLFKALAKMRLPQTLAGLQNLGSSITVVFNQGQSNRVSGGSFRRNVESVPGYRIQGVQNLDPSAGTALDLLMGSFMADPSMMEIFPSIEYGSESPSKSKLNRSLGGAVSGLNPKACLIIRMKPWRPEPVGKFASRAASLVTNVSNLPSGAYAEDFYKESVLEEAKNQALSAGQPAITDQLLKKAEVVTFNKMAEIGINLPNNIFNKATWPESPNAIGNERMHFIEPSEIFSLNYEKTDSAHVNTVSARGYRQAQSQLEFASAFMGLPYTNTIDIQERGVRYYRPEWPFFHIKFGEDDAAESMDERGYIRAVAAAALQIHAAASRFLSGQIQMHYRPDLKVGMCFRAGHSLSYFGEDRTDFEKEVIPPSGQMNRGQLVGYIEHVSHSIRATGDGGMRAETTIRFTRGLFNEDLPPVGLPPEQAQLPGNSIKNSWHQRYIGFSNERRFGTYTRDDFDEDELELPEE